MQTPRFLSTSQVIKIHERQIEIFGGTTGIRDEGVLDSALAQPQATFGGELLHMTIPEQAAAYLYHLAMNHPFIDGNKRNLQYGDSSSKAGNFQRRIICISRTAPTTQLNR